MLLLLQEFQKIIHRRMIKICFIALIAIQIFSFCASGIFMETTTVDGVTYRGLAAIQKDREITSPFEGELTNDKVKQIADQYGYVTFDEDEETFHGNFLSNFLYAHQLSDGYISDWDDYKNPTSYIPIESSAMGKIATETGITPYICYTRGWEVFQGSYSVGAMLTCIFLMIALSPIFAEEYSLKTANVLLTTFHGKKKDIWAKAGASYLLALLTFAGLMILTWFLCLIVFGLDGATAPFGVVSKKWYLPYAGMLAPCTVPTWLFLLISIGIAFLGVLMLTAFILFASAWAKQPFTALIISIIFYFLPIIIWFYLALSNVGYTSFFMYLRRTIIALPIYCCMSNSIDETMFPAMYRLRGWVFAVVVISSLAGSFHLFKNHQVS